MAMKLCVVQEESGNQATGAQCVENKSRQEVGKENGDRL